MVSQRENLPMVSCIMVTRDRRDFVLQSVRYFERQDYPARELIILDDDNQDLSPELPKGPRIRYFRVPRGSSIGAKRNQACQHAQGSIIAQWDDDDWYAANRLSAQIAPLLAGRAEVSALSSEIFFDLPRWEFWRCTPELHRRMFFRDVHGGTLVFQRAIYDRGVRYPNCSLAEDASFLQQALCGGARLEKLPGDRLFVYLRHAATSWRFGCGEFLDPHGWQRVPEPGFLTGDRDFYAARGPVHHPALQESPLVTCIMPTAGRRRLVAQSIRYFLRQDYANRELLILDDGPHSAVEIVPSDSRIRYVRLEGTRTLGAKRNLACEMAAGEFIAHWDDDDWSAPHRLSSQVRSLRENPSVGLFGLAQIYFFDPLRERAWIYQHPSGQRSWVAGGTMCYRKDFWSQIRFPDVAEGEDTRFVWADRASRILALDDPRIYAATVHPQNTSPKHTSDSRWHLCPIDTIREMLGEDWPFYTNWAAKGVDEVAIGATNNFYSINEIAKSEVSQENPCGQAPVYVSRGAALC
jgi:glycosyltransferase involved in cell wall biosynthesis